MKAALIGGAALALVALCVWVICRPKRREQNRQREQAQEHTESNTQGGEYRAPIAQIHAVESESPETATHKKWTDRERKKCHECVTLCIEALGIVGLAIYAYVSYESWQEMQKQTVDSARAWLGYQQVKDSNLPVAIDRVQVAPKLAVAAHYTIENFGNGPAIKVVSAFHVETSNDPATIKAWAAFICNAAVHFSTGTRPVMPTFSDSLGVPVGFTLFPRQTYSESGGRDDDAMPSLKWLYVMGCVAYLDQFKSWHWTRYCLVIGDGTNPISDTSPRGLYKLYNDTDETSQEDENEKRTAAKPRLTP